MVSRVVVTGIGVVSPFGVGRETFWRHVSSGCSGTRAITEFDASEFACRVAAPVTGVTIDDVPDKSLPPRRAFQKDPVHNLTGTMAAFRPDGALGNDKIRPASTGDYQAWTPE